MRIQEYLTCAIQNIQVLIKHVINPNKSIGVIAVARLGGSGRVISPAMWPLVKGKNYISYVAAIILKQFNAYRVSLGIV